MENGELITVYFISYIPCSFVGSWIMDKKGLRYGVLLGGFLQALGAGLRYFSCVFDPVGEAYVTLLGQILASIAMPFMVNSPAVLSANWFPPQLRATSTSVAVNANAMGTALVYLSAPFIVLSSDEVPYWNLYVALIATVSWIFALFFFRSFPRTGVAQSIVSDVQLRDEYDWSQWATAFTHSGFWHTVVAFSVAECILNAMCALLGKFLSVAHFTKAQIGIPIVLELGVECAYPTSEATVAALQQLCGNFLSAIIVPGLSALRRTHVDSTGHVPPKYFYASPEWVMVFMTATTFIIFCFFNGTYKRFAHEAAKNSRSRGKENVLITRTSRATGSFF
ncbi:Para-nitrobenzyl esterase [Phytophthora nicotianae]|uniref:Para-nitrobenzyl esterase n=1 Tax=Phytophthora nicotianae TaxID=4792 RepID=A0A0W8CTH7_PHYNI|nr:Para-nitrobenzyl esterase [Phytophthora nicotianae]